MIPVIDLFAGPGGLGEGFSSLLDTNGRPVFQTIMSIEKDEQARMTLRLRSYVRKIIKDDGSLPRVYVSYMRSRSGEDFQKLIDYDPEAWAAAGSEALCAELKDGDLTYVEEGRRRLAEYSKSKDTPWILIGGPPCQAYSLVGRSRRTHEKEKLEKDKKQTLYKCYLAFIRELKPTVFVMENVKGLLSAKLKGEGVFDLICRDMRDAGYEIRSLVKADAKGPKDYVVEAERYGIPQMRHRVILVGVKKGESKDLDILAPVEPLTLRQALLGIPKIRSDFSERNPNYRHMDWTTYVNAAIDRIVRTDEGRDLADILMRVRKSHPQRAVRKNRTTGERGPYEMWYRGRISGYRVLPNHESRTHLAADLDRYVFCAAYAEKHNAPARITDFPELLYPNHQNVHDLKPGEVIKFNDRFRVQLWDRPSTTITSHIAKDGHYYIHPDPEQCRCLTVREAARLQTFPDDYLFEGSRTSQYTQVGNAVPPLLAQQIGKIVAAYLGIASHGFCDALRPVSTGENKRFDLGA